MNGLILVLQQSISSYDNNLLLVGNPPYHHPNFKIPSQILYQIIVRTLVGPLVKLLIVGRNMYINLLESLES